MIAKIFILAVVMGAGVAMAAVTRNPALLGVSYIGPAPDYDCQSNGTEPHELCEYFYECWEGSATLAVCTEMQLFSLEYHGCDFAENVDCGDRVRPTGYPGTPTPPLTPEPTTATTTTTTTTAAPTTTVTTTTAAPPTTTTTVAPPTTTTTGTTTTTTEPPPHFDCPPTDGFYANPNDCASYFFCWAGNPFYFECPDGLHFNPEKDECDYKDEAGCEVKN